VLGCRAFAAPELLADDGDEGCGGAAGDMWAVGVLLYVLLCGALPFGGSRRGLAEAVLSGRYSVLGGFVELNAI